MQGHYSISLIDPKDLLPFQIKKKAGIKNKLVEKIRGKNNKNWMDLLRLSYDVKPKETTEIINQILNKDEKLISLAKKLTKLSK